MAISNTIWVFHGEKANFASAVFENEQIAFHVIKENHLSGILTCYTINELVYDWAIRNKYFHVKKEEQTSPNFKGRFSSGSQEHYHFYDGEEI